MRLPPLAANWPCARGHLVAGGVAREDVQEQRIDQVGVAQGQVLHDQLAGRRAGGLMRASTKRVVHQVERLQNGAILLARLVVAVAAQEAVQEGG